MSDQQKETCESCIHWHKKQMSGVIQLDQIRGECRAVPPTATTFMTAQGQWAGQVSAYPLLPPNMSKCGMHKNREE